MWLSTRENRGLNEEEDMWNEIWQHQQIYTIFLRHILTKVQKKIYDSVLYQRVFFVLLRCTYYAPKYFCQLILRNSNSMNLQLKSAMPTTS